VSSYISSVKRQGQHILSVLRTIFAGQPFLVHTFLQFIDFPYQAIRQTLSAQKTFFMELLPGWRARGLKQLGW
jgi:hypothetical protein